MTGPNNTVDPQLTEVLERIRDAFYALDNDWCFTYLNQRAEQILGRPRDELIGQNLWTAFPQMAGTSLETNYRLALKSQVPVTFEMLCPPGTQWFEMRGFPSAAGLTVYIRDVTSSHVTEAAPDEGRQQQNAHRLARLHEVTYALTGALTPQEVAHIFTAQGIKVVGAAAGSLAVLRAHEQQLELLDSRGYSTGAVEPWRQIPLSSPVMVVDAVKSASPIWMESPEAVARHYPTMPIADPDHRAWAALPLVVEGRAIGAVLLSFLQARTFTDEQKADMLALANQFAQALDRANIYHAERAARIEAEQARHDQALVADASRILAASLDYETALKELGGVIVPAIADYCLLHVVEANQQLAQPLTAASDPGTERDLIELSETYPADHNRRLVQQLYAERKAILSAEVGDDFYQSVAKDAAHLELLRRVGPRSFIFLPLITQGQVIGMMTLGMTDSGRRYTSRDVPLAEELSRRIAQAIDNARLYHEAEEQRQNLQVTLASIGDAVIATDSRGNVTFINAAAESLTGWRRSEAVGAPLQQVFHIINETSRVEVESPVSRVLRERMVLGLANHTLLIARDGTERPIDDSGAPILDQNGAMIGVILVFRDITGRRRTEKVLQSTLERIQDSYHVSHELGLAHTPDDILKALLTSRYADHIDQAAILVFDHPWTRERPAGFEILAALPAGKPLPGFAQNRRLDSSSLSGLISNSSPVFVEDAALDSRIDERARLIFREASRGGLGLFPLIGRGECFGLLMLYCPVRTPWTEEDVRHFQMFIEQVSVAVSNFRLLVAEAAARQEAENADQLKLQFLAMISHELRTPLASIKGFATTLMSTDVTWDAESQASFIAIIDEEANRLTELIDQLLDLSRLAAGKLLVIPQPVPLRAVIDGALPQLESVANQHRLVIDLAPGLPNVLADARRLYQILGNLVGNAAKFAPPHSQITISAFQVGREVQINVSDQGLGIAPEHRQRVFEAFRQLENMPARQSKGAGLGLAICKGLVDAHGGKIWIADQLMPGTTIAFTLPIVSDKD